MTVWLALVVGNSRSHWALFQDNTWQATWHTAPLSLDQIATLSKGNFEAFVPREQAAKLTAPQLSYGGPPLSLTAPSQQQQAFTQSGSRRFPLKDFTQR